MREGGEKQEEEEEEEEERRQGRRVDRRRRSDGVINDRVFNTLYGLAYKLRAVHRSSWQRINGRRRAEHPGTDLPLSFPHRFVRVPPPSDVTDLSKLRLERVIVSRFPSIAPVYPSLSSHVSLANEPLIQ